MEKHVPRGLSHQPLEDEEKIAFHRCACRQEGAHPLKRARHIIEEVNLSKLADVKKEMQWMIRQVEEGRVHITPEDAEDLLERMKDPAWMLHQEEEEEPDPS